MFRAVLCNYFCTVHFVMVPFNLISFFVRSIISLNISSIYHIYLYHPCFSCLQYVGDGVTHNILHVCCYPSPMFLLSAVRGGDGAAYPPAARARHHHLRGRVRAGCAEGHQHLPRGPA